MSQCCTQAPHPLSLRVSAGESARASVHHVAQWVHVQVVTRCNTQRSDWHLHPPAGPGDLDALHGYHLRLSSQFLLPWHCCKL
eukprot:193993-Rhodomonas_salina.1